MKAIRYALAVCALGLAARGALAADAPADGASTRGYLFLVGQVRSQMNADNREEIPALICGADASALARQASHTALLRNSLAGFKTDGVDPEALQFARNVDAILASYAAVCSDSAEFLREVAHQDAASPGSQPRLPRIRATLPSSQADVIGALGKLIDSATKLAPYTGSGPVSTASIEKKLSADLDGLLAAKEAHRKFLQTVKEDLPARYPSQDWTAREILP